MIQKKRADSFFLLLVFALLGVGFLISSSASLSTIGTRNIPLPFDFSQFIASVVGVILMLLVARIDYRLWRRFAIPLFISSLLLTLAVFLPVIGFEYNGARRWLNLGPFSLQPSEFLKLGFIIYVASWLSVSRKNLHSFRLGLVPYLLMIAVLAVVMLKQPDTGTFLIMVGASVAMFIAAQGRWLHFAYLTGIGVLSLGVLALTRDYVWERILTFFDPSHDQSGSSYQIGQSLIAIGSGGLFGRGYGQSIQKFHYLPESIGDSVFAVVGEELGFLGATCIVVAFTLFMLWGLKIASRVHDTFGRLLVVGLVMMIVIAAFMNIGAMVGIIPLTGVPLPFMSHGGSALIFTLIACGIVLSVSRHQGKVV